MTPVFPYLVRRSEDGWRGELLLRLRNGKAAYVVQLSMEQARMLATELRGLASDHCPLHHMTVRLAEALHAKISHVVIKRTGSGDEVAGILRVVTPTGLVNTYVDAAAGLALAIHMGLPVFMDGDFAPSEPQEEHRHPEPIGQNFGDTGLTHEAPTPIPHAFQEFIEGLQMPDGPTAPDSMAENSEEV